jgi:hypothetical protein
MFWYGSYGNKIWNDVRWWTDFYANFAGAKAKPPCMIHGHQPTWMPKRLYRKLMVHLVPTPYPTLIT